MWSEAEIYTLIGSEIRAIKTYIFRESDINEESPRQGECDLVGVRPADGGLPCLISWLSEILAVG